jgi:hypothetical protein
MNTLHTEAWDPPEVAGSEAGSTGFIELGEVNVSEDNDFGGDSEHGRVRLCGECSVGHCPECGDQLIPHLPAGCAVGSARTVMWYTQVVRRSLRHQH